MKNEAVDWLKIKSNHVFHNSQAKLFVFGSILTSPDSANDFDILIIAGKEEIKQITLHFKSLKLQFISNFGIPLHYQILSCSEAEEVSGFLEMVFSRPCQQVF
ncbi:hypothetical protein [Endozoicomonas lisbonensis]|uniref:Polymerase beta nucleotidyltransferase domain-containing protein n=1 Tax=Endozoicomonas lisbonensis TaxID=3120522 RepID=A0ABV2SCV7_9GAMM